jgi:hypothetical protein
MSLTLAEYADAIGAPVLFLESLGLREEQSRGETRLVVSRRCAPCEGTGTKTGHQGGPRRKRRRRTNEGPAAARAAT